MARNNGQDFNRQHLRHYPPFYPPQFHSLTGFQWRPITYGVPTMFQNPRVPFSQIPQNFNRPVQVNRTPTVRVHAYEDNGVQRFNVTEHHNNPEPTPVFSVPQFAPNPSFLDYMKYLPSHQISDAPLEYEKSDSEVQSVATCASSPEKSSVGLITTIDYSKSNENVHYDKDNRISLIELLTKKKK